MKYIKLYENFNPDDSAAVIINNADKILILQRGKTAPWMPLKWNLPGGIIEANETPEEAAIREAKEETSIDISNLKPVDKFLDPEGWTVYFFTTENYSGVISLTENENYKWITKEEINNYDFVPYVKEAIYKSNDN